MEVIDFKWSLADPAAGFRGGGTLGGVPTQGTLKTENSTDLTYYFWGLTQINPRPYRGGWCNPPEVFRG